MLDWRGPVLASSVKVDLIDETWGYRSTIGECKVYDPCRVTGLTPASWSPLRGAHDWGGAQKAAAAVRACTPMSTGPNASFWDTQMEQLLAGYFWTAAHFGAPMRDVCRWIAIQDSPTDAGPGEVMALLTEALTSDDVDVATDAGYAFETVDGIWSMQERTRADVYATARGAVWPWSNRTVAGTASSCDLTLDWLLDSRTARQAMAHLGAGRRCRAAQTGDRRADRRRAIAGDDLAHAPAGRSTRRCWCAGRRQHPAARAATVGVDAVGDGRAGRHRVAKRGADPRRLPHR